jgi:CRISPR system Cascade subunit CasE
MGVSHRLVWSLFPEDLTERPFLYRDIAASNGTGRAARGEFLILSTIRPEDRLKLFDLETKPFEPALNKGDRLHFSLRANPTVQRRDKVEQPESKKRKTRRFDVVMHALHKIPAGDERAEARPRLIREAGLGWLIRQGETAGFSLPDPDKTAIDGYEQFSVDPENGRKGWGSSRPGHSRIDFSGEVEVTDPECFLSRLATGFGRARAFGHGLMLIRRP